jgi:hypothetical protein
VDSASFEEFWFSLRGQKQQNQLPYFGHNRKKIFFRHPYCTHIEKYPLMLSVDRPRAGPRRRMADDKHRTNPVPGRSDRDGHARVLSVNPVSALRFASQHEPVCLTLGPESTSRMLQSHVIDIDGTFVGAAVRLDTGYRFIATDLKLDDLDGSIWPTLADVQRLARRIYLGGGAMNPPHSP